jgi:hypothetical protein
MELLFNEQDLVDSVCVFVAAREYTNPEDVEVDLAFNPSFGFSATAITRGRTRNLNEQDLIDSVAVYLRDYHNFNPDQLQVDLQFTENVGITASIKVSNF